MKESKKPEPPLKTWWSKLKGGRRGVRVQCWKNYDDGRPFPVYKVQVDWRQNFRDEWKRKETWNSSELETLFHILRMDALPFGYRIMQGQEEDGASSEEEE